jgi:hypothetical protein
VNFGERGKSSGRHPPTSTVKRGLAVPLTKGWPWTWSRGSVGFIDEVFEVMTQVDLGLTVFARFDSIDPVISVNDGK